MLVLKWTPFSPDLNPIENLWAILGRKTRERKPQNEYQLFQILTEAWESMDKGILNNLVDSLPRRIEAVIKNEGYPTKY